MATRNSRLPTLASEPKLPNGLHRGLRSLPLLNNNILRWWSSDCNLPKVHPWYSVPPDKSSLAWYMDPGRQSSHTSGISYRIYFQRLLRSEERRVGKEC